MGRLKKTITLFQILSLLSFLVPTSPALATSEGSYKQTNLVSDTPGLAKTTDVSLINPWGLSHSPTGPWWISDNNSGSASIYNGIGNSSRPTVSIPPPTGATGSGTPTGNVYNSASLSKPNEFVITAGKKSGPSVFMFATEDGTISGWNQNVDQNSAVLAADRSNATNSSGDMGAVYKGLAIGTNNDHTYIYATNFRFGTIEMFDANFKLVKSFTDTKIASNCPAAGQCYSPFGIQNIGGKLYVTFALQKVGKHDDAAGAGNGFVDVFNTNGKLIKRLIAHGNLNSPWGLARAPGNFGQFSGHLLVGNFGDGTINAYDLGSGSFDGQMKNASGKAIQINGLWGIAFGNGEQAGKRNELFFTAGIGDELHGLFGMIKSSDD
jgi:uncharacterized protein (TIGR03118 family)